MDEYIYHHLLSESGADNKWAHELLQDLEPLMLDEDYLTPGLGLRLTGNKRDKVMIEVSGTPNNQTDEILASNYDDLLKRSAKGRLKIGWHKQEAIYQVCYREEDLKQAGAKEEVGQGYDDDQSEVNEEEMLKHRGGGR